MEKNYLLLEKNFPDIYKRIFNIPISSNIKLIKTKSGDISAKIETNNLNKILHSSYNPKLEAQRLINSLNLPNDCIPLVFGFGLGYHIQALIENNSDFPQILVFETSKDILKFALDNINLEKILSNPKLKLYLDDNEQSLIDNLYSAISQESTKNKLKLVIHHPSLDLFKLSNPNLSDIIERIRLTPQAQEQLKENFQSNLPYIIRSPGINTLFNKFENLPVFLVSAGPTLHRDLPLLKTIGNRGIIICVSTIFSLLLKNKIKPDFVTIGDAKPIMLTHFKGLLDQKIPLIFLSTSAHNVIEKYKGPKIIALQNNFRMADVVSEKINKGRVDVGESVSTLILDIAIKSKANPIIFIGQDLAFTDQHTHSKGVSKRIKITQTSRTIKSITGKLLPASSTFFWILHWIEKRIAKENNGLFINCSQTGADISGTLAMPLEEVISKYCTKEIDKEQLIHF